MTQTAAPFMGSCEGRVRNILARLHQGEVATRSVFREVYQKTALQEACFADERKRHNQRLGPLDGAIVSVKDLFDVKGSKTVAGSRLLATHALPAVADAPVIDRLRQAGCVIIGRTNMSELAFSGVGNNIYFGTPANPVDPQCIPGGSSSGAAVSVALGLADIGLGSDTGGSLRIPAALCGVVGFKPSAGKVPTEGTFPLSTTLDTVGPIAATVEDCIQAFAVLADHPVPPMVKKGPYRLGIVHDARITGHTDDAVALPLQRAVDRLGESGVLFESVNLSPILDTLEQIDAIGIFPSIELAARLGPLSDADKGMLDPEIWERVRSGYHITAVDYLEMLRIRADVMTRMQQLMHRLDAILLATVPIVAPNTVDLADPESFHRTNRLLLRNTRIANLLNLPAVSIPLPVYGKAAGLMLWGKTDQDWALLNCARDIETAINKNELWKSPKE